MGGHGGLNILPQKSWHVYRLDNRLKVDKDKQKHHDREAAERKDVNSIRLKRNISTLRKRANKPSDHRDTSCDDKTSSSISLKPTKKHRIDSTDPDLHHQWGSGRHIHLFEDEEKEHEEIVTTHKKLVKELSLGDGKITFEQSDFTKDTRRKPWYVTDLQHSDKEGGTTERTMDMDYADSPCANPIESVSSGTQREILRQRRLAREGRERARAAKLCGSSRPV